MKGSGKPDLVEDLEGRRMNGVAAKFAVEVLVHFEQRDGNTAARQEQREDCSSRSATYHTTGSLLRAGYIRQGSRRLRGNRTCGNWLHLWSQYQLLQTWAQGYKDSAANRGRTMHGPGGFKNP